MTSAYTLNLSKYFGMIQQIQMPWLLNDTKFFFHKPPIYCLMFPANSLSRNWKFDCFLPTLKPPKIVVKNVMISIWICAHFFNRGSLYVHVRSSAIFSTAFWGRLPVLIQRLTVFSYSPIWRADFLIPFLRMALIVAFTMSSPFVNLFSINRRFACTQ